jgi:hypothetical protein
MSVKKDELRREYSPDLIKSGVRGKYAGRVRKEGSRLPRVGRARRGER